MTDAQTLTLTDFLLARIAEDEGAAQGHEGTTYLSWAYRPYGDGRPGGRVGPPNSPIAEDWHSTAYVPVAEHVARHDPARVLAQCAAHRRIVQAVCLADRHPETGELIPYIAAGGEGILRALASVYADHPDYRQEWA